MCHLQQPDAAATAAGSGPPLQSSPSPVTDVTGPEKTPGPVVMKDTKLAKLLKIAVPIIQGGAVGAFGGNWREPGSGSAAAQNFFSTRIAQQLAKQHADLATRQQASQDALRQSTEQRNQFYDKYLQSRIDRENYAEDHPKPEATHTTELSGYPGTGLYTSGPKAGQTYQMTKPVGDDYSGIGAHGPVPLGPPESEKLAKIHEDQRSADEQRKEKRPKVSAVTDADESGATTTNLIDENPESPTFGKTLKGGVGHRASKTPDKAKTETYAQEALKAAGNDPDKALTLVDGLKSMPPEMKQYVRARIREIKKPGKTGSASKLSPDVLKALAAGVPSGVPTSP